MSDPKDFREPDVTPKPKTRNGWLKLFTRPVGFLGRLLGEVLMRLLRRGVVEGILVVIISGSLILLLLVQNNEMMSDRKYLIVQEISFMNRLIAQTVFYALSILVVGGTLVYLNRKRK